MSSKFYHLSVKKKNDTRTKTVLELQVHIDSIKFLCDCAKGYGYAGLNNSHCEKLTRQHSKFAWIQMEFGILIGETSFLNHVFRYIIQSKRRLNSTNLMVLSPLQAIVIVPLWLCRLLMRCLLIKWALSATKLVFGRIFPNWSITLVSESTRFLAGMRSGGLG